MSVLGSVVAQICSRLSAVDGLVVYAYVPDDFGTLPAAVVYGTSGRVDWAAQQVVDDLIMVRIDVLVSRSITAVAFENLYVLRDAVLSSLLADPTLSGAADTITGISYQLVYLTYGQTPALAYQFDVEVKVML